MLRFFCVFCKLAKHKNVHNKNPCHGFTAIRGLTRGIHVFIRTNPSVYSVNLFRTFCHSKNNNHKTHMSDSWKDLITKEWKKRQQGQVAPFKFPLNQTTFDEEEIIAMIDAMLHGKLSRSVKVDQFEKEFAEKVGSKYAILVNSGSSANLLAVAAVCQKTRANYLKPGDEILVPSLCWSTSVFPLIQYGLVPVFVDVDPFTLNITMDTLKAKVTPKTRGLFLVHVMGNCVQMKEVMDLAAENNWVVVEDTCESLMSKCDGKVLGTFGSYGTYSFYFSHHLCTGEGGMVVCNTKEDYNLARSLRAHGWTRDMEQDVREAIEKQYPDIDNRFNFVYQGYNLRPMEVQGAMGIVQLKKLDKMNKTRVDSYYLLKALIEKHPKYSGQFEFIKNTDDKRIEPIWFGFPCLLKPELKHLRPEFLTYLTNKSVENRPILTGNFVRQPALKEYVTQCPPETFVGADRIHYCGFYVGANSVFVDEVMLSELADIIVSFFADKK